jgi:microcystin-dependent protein
MDAYIGQISAFPFTSGRGNPNGWLLCDGSTISVTQYTALFALLGTTYGGDGVKTFGIPDLRGRVPVGQGKSAISGNTYTLGGKGGVSAEALTAAQLPAHTHTLTPPATLGTLSISDQAANASNPGTIGAFNDPNQAINLLAYNNATPNITLNAGTGVTAPQIGISGSSLPVTIFNPSMPINYYIAWQGIYPTPD